MSREALIILGKCHWYRNNYREAHTVLNRIKITSLDNLSLHHQKLLVDYYAFYGMILLLNLVTIVSILLQRFVSGVCRSTGRCIE